MGARPPPVAPRGRAAVPPAIPSEHSEAPRHMSALRPLFSVLCLVAAALFLGTACSHYQLGTGAKTKLAFQTLYIEPVENKTLLPQARVLVSTQLREAFARDARVSLVNSPEAADATLAVTITSYRRDVLTVREGDTGLARKFNVTLATTATLRDRRGNQVLFESRPLSVQREVFTDSGQLQSEYQTLPLLAQSLAAKVTHAALDIW